MGEMRSKCKGRTACGKWDFEEWVIIKLILNFKEICASLGGLGNLIHEDMEKRASVNTKIKLLFHKIRIICD
jgi:hypothetical protein